MTKPKLPWLKMIVYLPFALANIAFGLALMLSMVPFLFPLGLALLGLAAAPYAQWMSKKIHADIAYANRDHSLNEGEALPWEEEGGTGMSEDDMINIILNGNGRGSIQ